MTYFNFKAVKNISQVLISYDGKDMRTFDPAFRKDLTTNVGLPFAPPNYTIKRNYKRVFECSMLATYIGDRLIVSDIGKALSSDQQFASNPEWYLHEVETRFRYPFPSFIRI